MTAHSAVEWEDEDSVPGLSERIEAELALEREQAFEAELEREERPPNRCRRTNRSRKGRCSSAS